MADYQIEILPAALEEAADARDWYERRNSVAAESFLSELDHAISQIAREPTQWPKFEHGTHRYVFPRFPFNLIYRVKEEVIEILAIAHQKRKPGYWRDRG